MRPATIGVLYGHRLDTGGVETQLIGLMRRCDPARFRWLVASTASTAFTESAQGFGAQVVPWEPAHGMDLAAQQRLLDLLRHHPVDLLHLHSLRALLFGRAVAWRLKLPAVATIHLPARAPVGGSGAWARLRHRLYDEVEASSF